MAAGEKKSFFWCRWHKYRVENIECMHIKELKKDVKIDINFIKSALFLIPIIIIREKHDHKYSFRNILYVVHWEKKDLCALYKINRSRVRLFHLPNGQAL